MRPGGGHCAHQCLMRRCAVGDLVAVATDDEQRVVHREGQTHCDGEIHREDRDVGEEALLKRSTANEPRMANMPIVMGSAAASIPPNTHTSATKLTGNRDRFHQHEVALGLLLGLGVGQRAAGAHDDAAAFAWNLVDEFACDLGVIGIAAAAGWPLRSGRRCALGRRRCQAVVVSTQACSSYSTE